MSTVPERIVVLETKVDALVDAHKITDSKLDEIMTYITQQKAIAEQIAGQKQSRHWDITTILSVLALIISIAIGVSRVIWGP